MNIYAVCVCLLGLIWFLLILSFELSPVDATDEAFKNERRFEELYGNDPETSGNWQLARDIRDNPYKMKKLSSEVHRKVFLQKKPAVLKAMYARKELHFFEREYKPIKIDVLMYAVDEYVSEGVPQHFHHFTKGLWPDCVFYLKSKDAEGTKLTIFKAVCAIDLYRSSEGGDMLIK